jgi:DNA-binding SARP family transcriptional activator
MTANHGQAVRPDGVASTLQLRVLGPPLLSWTSPQTAEEVPIPLGPRQRELLVLLALHPDGITRERIADTLWPDAAPERPFNALHTTLTRLRRNVAAATGATHTEVTRAEGARYHLDRRVIDTDYWAFADAVADRHCANTDEDRLLSSRRIIVAYRGELGDGIDAEWLEAPREAVRRDALDAASLVAQLVLAEDPQQALDAYEAAQRIDPYNEQIYRHLMMVQARLARPDAIDRTLALLRTRLSEIDEGPDPKTLALADRLRQEATSSDLSAPRADAAIAGIR